MMTMMLIWIKKISVKIVEVQYKKNSWRSQKKRKKGRFLGPKNLVSVVAQFL